MSDTDHEGHVNKAVYSHFHLAQPLDVGVFESMKAFYNRELQKLYAARILMLDMTNTFSCEVTDDICVSLENAFAVACNFSGPSRIPFFSLMALKEHPEVILPYSYVRNNFQRIQSAVEEARVSLYQSDSCHSKHPSCIHQAMEEAASQFVRQLHSTLHTGGFCQQLEIIIFTTQKVGSVQKQVESAVASLDMEHVRRVQVVSLPHEELMTLEDLTVGTSQSSEGSNAHSNSSISTSGLVETLTLEPDVLSLQNFFNGWLLDSGTDSEHMHIILPPLDDSDELVVIKCDLHERIINPAQLPFYSQFTIHGDSATMKTVFPSTSKAMGLSVPVNRLQVVALVPVTAVCDSVVYGLPMIAQPTSCWKIDWDDLERNQQSFRALCHSLINKMAAQSKMKVKQKVPDQAMIACVQPQKQTKHPTHRNNSHDDQPTGHFVLFPASNGSLLVKCIAAQELMLPYNIGNHQEEPSEDYSAVISESLDQVETIESFNPLFYQSNLYNSLKNMGKKPQAPRQQKRPINTNDSVCLTNKMTSTKQSRGSKRQAVETSPEFQTSLTDTPLSDRVLKKGLSRPQKRSLYSAPHDKFDEETSTLPHENICTVKSGRYNRVKPMLQFPTSL